MSDEPTRLRSLLAAAGRTLGMEAPEESAHLYASWSEIVGPDVARHAKPGVLKAGILKVWVDSPAWATELTYLGPQIVARSTEIVGREVVREIRPYLGREPHSRASTPCSSSSAPATSARTNQDADDDPMGALARARLAWEKRARRGSSRHRPDAPSKPQIRR
ncbi:MAG: DUF721 domain-containing protein [Actinomycetota bacterium]|nr:DUF721 domain-containing protein [Actinomycetota bacterium]